ncbi:MAG: DNA-directed RNA polymerase subunit omega [Acidobacteriota bacterium]|nr:DNA-directed RNA polymerase subunit omega [Acidobacteriota bacterium]
MTEIRLENYDSKFRFILLASHRAEQLMRGARPRLDSDSPKVAKAAMAEVDDGMVEWDYGPAPVEGVDETAEGLEGGEEAAPAE